MNKWKFLQISIIFFFLFMVGSNVFVQIYSSESLSFLMPHLKLSYEKEQDILKVLKDKGGICFDLLNDDKTDFRSEEIKNSLMRLFYETESSIFARLEKLQKLKFQGQSLNGDFLANLLFKGNWTLDIKYSKKDPSRVETITDIVYSPKVEAYLKKSGFIVAADNYTYNKAKRILLQGIKFKMDINTGLCKVDVTEKFLNSCLQKAGIIDSKNIIQPEPCKDVKRMEEFFSDMRDPEMFPFKLPINPDKKYLFDEIQKMLNEKDETNEYIMFRERIKKGYGPIKKPGVLDGKTIVFSLRNFEINSCGVATYVPIQLAHLLMRNNVTIHLIYTASNISKKSELNFGSGKLVFHPVSPVNYAARMGLEMERIQRQNHVDGIMVHEPHDYESYTLMYYAKKNRIPSIVTYHLGAINQRLRYAEYVILQHRAFSMATAVGTVSDNTKAYVKWLLPDKLSINIGPMFDFDTFSLTLQKGEKSVRDTMLKKDKIRPPENAYRMFLPVRLIPSKGIYEILQACKKAFMDKQRNDFYLILIKGSHSDENYSEKIESYIRENHMTQNAVIIERDLSLSQMRFYYSFVDFTILPTYAEALGLVLLESQLMNIPVVAFNIDGAPEAFINELNNPGRGTGYGIDIEGCSKQQIVEKISKLFQEIFPQRGSLDFKTIQKKHFQMGMRAREFIEERFNPYNVIKYVEQAIDFICKKEYQQSFQDAVRSSV